MATSPSSPPRRDAPAWAIELLDQIDALRSGLLELKMELNSFRITLIEGIFDGARDH